MGVYVAEPDIETGRAVTDALISARFAVSAALWLYMSEAGEWRLIIATPLVDKWGPRRAYSDLQVILAANQLRIDLSKISLVSPKDSLIRLLKSSLRFHGPAPGIRFTGNTVNNVYIEDAYVYRI